jgi:omega-3 fatty acid desaturase (delta-15 desaturase)
MSFPEKLIRFYAPLIAYPVYLFKRSPSRAGGSHFNPSSPLFKPNEKNDILTSTAAILTMVACLGWFTFQFGAIAFFKFYFVPYLVFVIWLDLVTYLHHTEDNIPWYRGDNWYYLKGALSTIDRDYGIFNNIHHNIGTHVAHHIFHTIPHYYLKDATEAVKPILGDYYRISHEPIWKSFFKSQQVCHYVPDQGDEVYYRPSK